MSQPGDTLKSGQLGTADVTASTVANIGPGIDFYFAFGVIAVTAGVAAPLTILAAGVGCRPPRIHGGRVHKGRAFGRELYHLCRDRTRTTGRRRHSSSGHGRLHRRHGSGVHHVGRDGCANLAHYTSWNLAWGPLTLVLTVGAIWLTMRGVKLSTTAVGVAVLIQVTVMVLVCVIVLVDQRAHLSAAPFSWAHLTGGLTGLSAGFPLALYMFIGWENGPALAEECRTPKRTVPRALYISVAIGGASVRLLRLFDRHRIPLRRSSSIGRSSVPFLSRGRPLSRWSGHSGLACRHRLGARHPGRRARTRRHACCSTAVELVFSLLGWADFGHGSTLQSTRSWSWQRPDSESSAFGGRPTSSPATQDR